MGLNRSEIVRKDKLSYFSESIYNVSSIRTVELRKSRRVEKSRKMGAELVLFNAVRLQNSFDSKLEQNAEIVNFLFIDALHATLIVFGCCLNCGTQFVKGGSDVKVRLAPFSF